MTTPGPAHIIDCTIVELAPAVTDPITGNVLKPPLLRMPQQYSAELGSDMATLLDPDTGDPVLAAPADNPDDNPDDQPVPVRIPLANLAAVETADDWATRQADAAAEAASAEQEQAQVNEQTGLHTRNRWLGETDAYMLPTAAYPADMPDEVKQAIADNQTAIAEWRTQLRDWPATVTDWNDPPALPAPPTITLTSGRQLIIVT